MRKFLAAAILLVASLSITAQQPQQPPPAGAQQPPAEGQGRGGRGGRGGGGEAPAPSTAKPLVPVAASTVVNNPDQFLGESVSLTAAVESNLTKSSFSVDQDKTKTQDKDILIIAPTLQNAPEANAYVTVLGELVKFDPDT